MARPTIFTISANWDEEARVWCGYCDAVPVAADAPTLDELLKKINEMALDVLADNRPGLVTENVFFQLSALREAAPVFA